MGIIWADEINLRAFLIKKSKQFAQCYLQNDPVDNDTRDENV